MSTLDSLISRYIPESYPVEQKGNILLVDVDVSNLVEYCGHLYADCALPLKTITATDERKDGKGFRILYVFGIPGENVFIIPFVTLQEGETFPSVVSVIHEASGYERKIHSFFGLRAEGRPALSQMILHDNWPQTVYPLRKDFDWNERPSEAKGVYEFQKVEGEGVYEIPVGPIHAGVIEPGHFRFSVAGEEIVLLEARLGYKHKGIEKLFEQRSPEEGIRLAERVSGDTSFTHALAYCQAVERMAGIDVAERAACIRVVFSELERLANHLNDIGFVMLDTGFSFGGSQCSRLRERIMQLNESLSGDRFLRGLIAFGGVKKDLNAKHQEHLLEELKSIKEDFSKIIEVAYESTSLLNRLDRTGRLDHQIALDHGVTGIAGRAAGIEHDARKEYPYAVYGKLKFEMALETDSDVEARWNVRIKEVYTSMALIEQVCDSMKKAGKLQAEQKVVLPKHGIAIGIAEGWRGDIVYTLLTDSDGNYLRVDVRDPSFPNWHAVGHAVKGNIVPDFPLINKSFNLSYSGYDL
jgi:Ni,Fe-hydrogenase III large subunit/NADH:ubiquinone oxidoreductase subunit C